MEEIVNGFKSKKAKAIVKALKSSQINNDQSTLHAINATSGKVNLSFGHFNRIRKDIVLPADKKLLLHYKDSTGAVAKTYHLQDRLININNLFIDQENQYSFGADVDLNTLPSTTLETKWLSNPSRSRSKRKKFSRYLTRAEYNIESFQVYSDDVLLDGTEDSFDPETDSDIQATSYPCFLFAPPKAGVDSKVVKQISQTMFNSGATVVFIRRTTKAFNLCISVKQFRFDNTSGRAKNDITVYGEKSDSIFNLGSVGAHLFTIMPTNRTKRALDNPELVAEHGRSDFIIKGTRVVFNDKRSNYSIDTSKYDQPTQYKYQEVRSLDKGDFHENNLKEMSRLDGKELKLGQPPFRTFNSKTRKFYDVSNFNVIYFDFETLTIDGVHVPYCVSYLIAEVNDSSFFTPSFSETKNIYGLGCEKQFLESLPEKSYNLLWAYNAGFISRFLLKHKSVSLKDTNMIDCGTKIKQAHGFFKGREIVIRDVMSFLSVSPGSLPKMYKEVSKSISLEKVFPTQSDQGL